MNNAITPEQQAILRRAERLRQTVNSDGWRDVIAISELIASEALKNLEAYKGTDEKETATLAFIWKAVRAHHQKLLATVEDWIEEGRRTALDLNKSRFQAGFPQPGTEPMPSATAVIPLCDMPELETEEHAGTEQ